ncbi:MAG: ECF RNA polymerase sigma factor SigW [bacterium]|nr:ECF RNA polymerase sigma factor SigW [bacterium]
MPSPRVKETREVDEDLLVEAARQGDRRAARALYDLHRERVWRVVYRMVLDVEEARELCQETWLRAFSSIGRYHGRSRFGTWLLSIALNAARSRWRRRKRLAPISLSNPPEGVELLPPVPASQRVALEESRRSRAIEEALRHLPAKQRQAFVLRYFEELSITEVAAAMGCREGSVKSHLFRAIQALRRSLRSLSEEGGGHDETSL